MPTRVRLILEVWQYIMECVNEYIIKQINWSVYFLAINGVMEYLN